jgi:hypothetical protein
MRLDRELGRFFRFLDERIGLSNVGTVLSSGHGVAPLPEIRNAGGFPRAGAPSPSRSASRKAGRLSRRRSDRKTGSSSLSISTTGPSLAAR